jgi:hypothetical protein
MAVDQPGPPEGSNPDQPASGRLVVRTIDRGDEFGRPVR